MALEFRTIAGRSDALTTIPLKHRITSYNVCYTKLLRVGALQVFVVRAGQPVEGQRFGNVRNNFV